MDDIIILAMLPKQNQKETAQLTAIALAVQSFSYLKVPGSILDKLNTLSSKYTTKKGHSFISWMKDKVQSQQILEQLAGLVNVQTIQNFSSKQRYVPLLDKIKNLNNQVNDLKKQEKRFEQMLGIVSFSSKHLSLQQKMNQFVYSMATSELLLNYVVSTKRVQFPTERLQKSTPNIKNYGESLWMKMESQKQTKAAKQIQMSNIEKNFAEAKLNLRLYSLTQNFKKIKEYYDQKLKKHSNQNLMIKQSQFNFQLAYIKTYLFNIVQGHKSNKDYLQKISDNELKTRLSNYSQLLQSKCSQAIKQIRQSLKCSAQKQKRQLLLQQRKVKQQKNEKQQLQQERVPYQQISFRQGQEISRLKDKILNLEERNDKLQGELKSMNAKNNNQTQRFNGAKYQRTDTDERSKQKISDLERQVQRLLQQDFSNKEKIDKNQLYRKQTTAKITQLQMSNQNQKQELDSLNNEIIQNGKKIKNLQKNIKEKEAHIQIFKVQCQKLKNQIKDCLVQKQRLADSLQQRVEVEKGERSKQVEFQSSLSTLKQSLLEKNGTVKNMSEQLLLLRSQCDSWKTKYQQCLSELESAKLTATKNIESVNALQSQLEERIQKEKERMDRQSIEQINMRLALKQVTDKKQKLQGQVDTLIVKNQSNKQKLMARIKQLQTQKNEEISAVKRENNSLRQELLELQQKYNEQVQRNNVPFEDNQSVSKEVIVSQNEWKQKLREEENKNTSLLKQLEDERKNFKKAKSMLQAQCAALGDQAKTYQSQLSRTSGLVSKLQQERSRMPTIPDDIRQLTLFENQIFEGRRDEKHTLIQQIQRSVGRKIQKAKLLFNFDPLNPTGFHKYLDNKDHLLCVVKTEKAIFAGYYPGNFISGIALDKGGLLISVTNNESYRLLQRKSPQDKLFKGMVYDEFFLIFGNSELRLRNGTKDVFSNFGVSNAFYDSRGHKINNFLNDGNNRETVFQHCECYQLFF